MDLPPNFEYFEKGTSSIFEKIIKEQGTEVCQNMLYSDYISNQSKKYDFGIAHTIPSAQIGKKTRSKSDSRRLSSFILCNLFPKLGQVEISLVCSSSNVKHGKILMDLVYQKAQELGYKYLFLLSLSESKLINWYKRLGFYILSEKSYSSGEVKAHAMIKDII